MVAFRQYGYSHPKIETACTDVTKPQFSGCAGHVETYLGAQWRSRSEGLAGWLLEH
jgi:hypothetical protein